MTYGGGTDVQVIAFLLVLVQNVIKSFRDTVAALVSDVKVT